MKTQRRCGDAQGIKEVAEPSDGAHKPGSGVPAAERAPVERLKVAKIAEAGSAEAGKSQWSQGVVDEWHVEPRVDMFKHHLHAFIEKQGFPV